MRILVFNAGSSSLKLGVFDIAAAEIHLFKATLDRFAAGRCVLRFAAGPREGHRDEAIGSLEAAIAAVPRLLEEFGIGAIEVVGHRVVHGGTAHDGPATIDDALLAHLETLTPLAPLHNPANLEGIRLARAIWPGLPQVAVFDTAFHLTSPPAAHTYAVPAEWRAAGLRRFGFHGTSHKYVAQRAAEEIGARVEDLQIVSCHLGNGASVCAINRGRSMDTSMGMTPLEGLVMGTRSGDVDPGLFGYLHRGLGLGIADIEDALNGRSGLLALAGTPDMREVERLAAEGDAAAQLAIDVFAYRARKYVGAYAAAMGGIDALVFTGGIGENSPSMRRRICDGLHVIGLSLDYDRNQRVELTGHAAPQIQAYGSRVRVIVTETAEQLMIAREAAQLLSRRQQAAIRIPVAVSARHVHLSAAALAALYGEGQALTLDRPLSQPGQFAAKEMVRVVGPKGALERVRVLGPLRGRTQIEVSRTDSFALGIEVPVRASGQIDRTPRVLLEGPAGRYETDGLIIAERHIHTNPQDAARLGLADGQYVSVRIEDAERGLEFGRTLVRVSDPAFTEMHIDTDEANAADLDADATGEIVLQTDRASAVVVA